MSENSVSQNQREAVVLIANLQQGSDVEKAFYRFVAWSAENVAVSILSPSYSRITVVKDSSATLSNLVSALRSSTGKAHIKAVDVIFVTHGLDDRVLFSDGRASMTTVSARIAAELTAGQRAKLRALYSTACWGETHRDEWLGAGFKVASGARQVHADSLTSYGAFLGAWALGNTFASAVDTANASDPLRASDAAGNAWFASGIDPGYKKYVGKVESYREVSGKSSLTINLVYEGSASGSSGAVGPLCGNSTGTPKTTWTQCPQGFKCINGRCQSQQMLQ